MSDSPRKSIGFTVLEILIVVSILAVLAAVSTPLYREYIRNSRRSACIANLKVLYGAVEQRRMLGIHEINLDELCSSMGYVKGEPRCPADKSQPYDISGEVPICPNAGKYPDHALPVR